MSHPIDRGLPFELDDAWRPSLFTASDGDVAVDESLFGSSLDLSLPKLDDVGYQPESFSLFGLEIPELLQHRHETEPEHDLLPSPTDQSAKTGVASDLVLNEQDPLDIWTIDPRTIQGHGLPCLRTWEAFAQQAADPVARDHLYVSEAGPDGYNASLSEREPTSAQKGVLPQHIALRALQSLAVGRSSLFFQWDEAEQKFRQTLPKLPFHGFSVESSDSLVSSVMRCGATFASLQAFASAAPVSRNAANATVAALKRCTAICLELIDDRIYQGARSVRSLLQLQALLRVPDRLLHLHQELVLASEDCTGTDSALENISRQISECAACDPELRAYSEALLEQVCAPTVERIFSQVGLLSIKGTEIANPPYGRDIVPDVADNLPSFVDGEIGRCVRETKAAVEILREQLADHPLLVQNVGQEQDSPSYTWPGHSDLEDLLAKAKRYEANVLAAIAHASPTQDVSKRLAPGGIEASTAMLEVNGEAWAWQEHEAQACHLRDLDSKMSTTPTTRTAPKEQGFREAVVQTLRSQQAMATRLNIGDVTDVSPFTRYHPLFEMQWRLANGTLLRYIMGDCGLREQFKLQYDFRLFGSAEFVTRLSTALFSQDAQSAERKRGNVPTSTSIGLRLGTSDDQRWPPASSELRLALADVLDEARSSSSKQQATEKMEMEPAGKLNFAIHELTDAEIEKVMDLGSIYALDFLKLQYEASPPLDMIFTTDATERYDDVFRHLLRLLRLLHVTSNVRQKVLSRRKSDTLPASMTAFSIQSHHFVTVLMSYTMDVGITMPWQRFLSQLDKVQMQIRREDSNGQMGTEVSIGVEGLRKMHDTFLESVRARLFLRQKQSKLRSAMGQLGSAILQSAICIERNGTLPAKARRGFRDAARDFLDALADVARRPYRTGAGLNASDGGEGVSDNELAKMLLLRLNWNGFHTGGLDPLVSDGVNDI